MFARLLTLRSIRNRRVYTAVALIAYLTSVVGFPLPLPAARDISTPFPCQDHHCGCHSADQCWQSCCCFTPAQRLAWAREHNVTIPADVRATMLCASHADHDRDAACCEHGGDDSGSSDHSCSQCKESGKTAKVAWVFGFQAQKCQGLTMLWVAIGATLPLEIRPLWQFQWVPAGGVCCLDDEFSSLSSQPTVPPPRA